MIFHWWLIGSKSLRVFRSILAISTYFSIFLLYFIFTWSSARTKKKIIKWQAILSGKLTIASSRDLLLYQNSAKVYEFPFQRWILVLASHYLIYFRFLILVHQVFTQYLVWEKVLMQCIQYIYVLQHLSTIFSLSHWYDSHQETNSPSKCNFCISYWLKLTGILFMSLYVSHVFIPIS